MESLSMWKSLERNPLEIYCLYNPLQKWDLSVWMGVSSHINSYGNFNNLKVLKYFISAQQACPLENVVDTTSNTTSNTTSTSYCSLQDINMVCTANTDQSSTEMVRQLLKTWALTSHVFFPREGVIVEKTWNGTVKPKNARWVYQGLRKDLALNTLHLYTSVGCWNRLNYSLH